LEPLEVPLARYADGTFADHPDHYELLRSTKRAHWSKSAKYIEDVERAPPIPQAKRVCGTFVDEEEEEEADDGEDDYLPPPPRSGMVMFPLPPLSSWINSCDLATLLLLVKQTAPQYIEAYIPVCLPPYLVPEREVLAELSRRPVELGSITNLIDADTPRVVGTARAACVKTLKSLKSITKGRVITGATFFNSGDPQGYQTVAKRYRELKITYHNNAFVCLPSMSYDERRMLREPGWFVDLTFQGAGSNGLQVMSRFVYFSEFSEQILGFYTKTRS
jgi:hypothetical protein